LCGRREAPVGFAAVQVAADAGLRSPSASGAIEIEFAGGARVRITGSADPAIVSALIAALAKIARPR
jgi:transposase